MIKIIKRQWLALTRLVLLTQNELMSATSPNVTNCSHDAVQQ